MARFRVKRVIGPTLRLLIVVVAGLLATRYLVTTLRAEGLGPAGVFALLVFIAVVALFWRAVLNMKRAVRRLRT